MSVLVACVPDLMDRSRVAAVAPATTFVKRPDDLVGEARRLGADLVVADLSRPGAVEAVALLAAEGVATIGFGSHVDSALLEAARVAGCGRVLTRAVFFRQLDELVG